MSNCVKLIRSESQSHICIQHGLPESPRKQANRPNMFLILKQGWIMEGGSPYIHTGPSERLNESSELWEGEESFWGFETPYILALLWIISWAQWSLDLWGVDNLLRVWSPIGWLPTMGLPYGQKKEWKCWAHQNVELWGVDNPFEGLKPH